MLNLLVFGCLNGMLLCRIFIFWLFLLSVVSELCEYDGFMFGGSLMLDNLVWLMMCFCVLIVSVF